MRDASVPALPAGDPHAIVPGDHRLAENDNDVLARRPCKARLCKKPAIRVKNIVSTRIFAAKSPPIRALNRKKEQKFLCFRPISVVWAYKRTYFLHPPVIPSVIRAGASR